MKFVSQKGQLSFCISLNLNKKGRNSVKSLKNTSKYKIDVYIMMFYLSVKFERTCCIPLKVSDRKTQIDTFIQTRRQKRAINQSKICWNHIL